MLFNFITLVESEIYDTYCIVLLDYSPKIAIFLILQTQKKICQNHQKIKRVENFFLNLFTHANKNNNKKGDRSINWKK